MADHWVVCAVSRSGNVWDNAAMESFFSSLKTERIDRKTYRTRDEAKADVSDYIERFHNVKRWHSTIGFLSPVEFERQAGFAQVGVIQTRCRPRVRSLKDLRNGLQQSIGLARAPVRHNAGQMPRRLGAGGASSSFSITE